MRRAIVMMVGVGAMALGALAACGGGGGGGGGADGRLVALTTAAANPGVTGQAYSTTFEAVFPHPPGLFSVTAGQLPPGVVLDAQTGEVTGYPRAVGTYHFQIAARDGADPAVPAGRDSNFAEDRRNYSVAVSRGPPQILPQVVPAAQYRAAYGYQIDAAGGTPPYSFAVTGGTLPAGLAVSPTGYLGSFPTKADFHPYHFDVTVTDYAGLTHTRSLTVDVVVLPLVILTSSIPSGARNFPYDVTLDLASTGAGAPISWSQATPLAGETLLSTIGMQITPIGHVTTLPSLPGPSAVSPLGGFLFTAQVTDEANQLVKRQYTLDIVALQPVLTKITPKASTIPGPFTVTGLNFQVGAQLIFKPGATQVVVSPTYVDRTKLTFATAPPAPLGNGPVTVRVLNPDGTFADLPNGFAFPFANLSFGTGGFVSSDISSTGVAVGDLTGDGLADIVHCGAAGFKPCNNFPSSPSASGGLVLLKNAGGLSFTTTSLSSGNFFDVEIADVNTDGKPDIVALGANSIQVWLNGPLGTFTAGPTTSHSATNPQDMQVALLNNDLVPDIAFGASVYGNTAGSAYTFVGSGTGSFTQVGAATSGITNCGGIVALTAVDFDGDGLQDVVAGAGFHSSGPFYLRSPSTAAGGFGGWVAGPNTANAWGSVTSIAAGDFFGDGRPAVVGNYSVDPSDGGYRQLAMFSGTNLATAQTLATPGTLGKCIGVGDWDFDGKADFALSTHTSTLNVYRGTNFGLLQSMDAASVSGTSSPRTGRISSGDLDGDGRIDLVVATSYWARDYQPDVYGASYLYPLNLSGDGGSKGLVFYLNSSN